MLQCSKYLTYYAQYYAHVKELCLKFDCSIREYIQGKYSSTNKNYGECSIRVYLSNIFNQSLPIMLAYVIDKV